PEGGDVQVRRGGQGDVPRVHAGEGEGRPLRKGSDVRSVHGDGDGDGEADEGQVEVLLPAARVADVRLLHGDLGRAWEVNPQVVPRVAGISPCGAEPRRGGGPGGRGRAARALAPRVPDRGRADRIARDPAAS